MKMLNRISGVLAVVMLGWAITVHAEVGLPYKSSADPSAEFAVRSEAAKHENKFILMVFGGNWCPDCRRLHRAMQEPSIKPTIGEHFVVMHVDVGNWDHNLDFVEKWGNPIEGGIPAVVIADVNQQVVYRTEPGELATARNMGTEELAEAFKKMARSARGE